MKCKGTHKDTYGLGCRTEQEERRLGLGIDCGCWRDFLLSPKGKERIKRHSIRAKKKVAKEKKAEKKNKENELVDWSKKLVVKMQEIARLIDAGQPCLARGNHPGQMHGGHVFSKGSNPTMKFNLHNIHRQGAQSNHFQNDDGLLREGLINEYGQDYYEFLSEMRSCEALKYTNMEYMEFYKKACKESNNLRKSGETFLTPFRRQFIRTTLNISKGIYPDQWSIYKNY